MKRRNKEEEEEKKGRASHQSLAQKLESQWQNLFLYILVRRAHRAHSIQQPWGGGGAAMTPPELAADLSAALEVEILADRLRTSEEPPVQECMRCIRGDHFLV